MSIKYNPSTVAEMSNESHGTYYLADNPNLYEIQRSNNYEFIITDIDDILKSGYDPQDANSRVVNAQEILRLSVTKASVPHFSQKVITTKRGNTQMKFAGVPEFGQGSVDFYDYIGVETKEALMAWQNLSFNIRTEKVGLASDYKKDCYLVEYSPDYQVVRRWILHGCWISKIEEDNYDSEQTNTARKIRCTFEYDRGEIDTSED